VRLVMRFERRSLVLGLGHGHGVASVTHHGMR
jgi:hypothetical protein